MISMKAKGSSGFKNKIYKEKERKGGEALRAKNNRK